MTSKFRFLFSCDGEISCLAFLLVFFLCFLCVIQLAFGPYIGIAKETARDTRSKKKNSQPAESDRHSDTAPRPDIDRDGAITYCGTVRGEKKGANRYDEVCVFFSIVSLSC